MALLQGNSFVLFLDRDRSLLRGETSTGISYDANLIEVTKGITGRYAEYIPGVQTSSINFEKLHTFEETLEVGDEVTFHIGPRSLGYEGLCVIESITIEASSDDVQRYSGTCKVTGPVTKFIPIFEESILCTTDGREICTTGGETICVSEQIN